MKAATAPETLASRVEIREILGVSKTRVSVLEGREDFPPPIDVLEGGRRPVWWRSDIEAYRDSRRTEGGRPKAEETVASKG